VRSVTTTHDLAKRLGVEIDDDPQKPEAYIILPDGERCGVRDIEGAGFWLAGYAKCMSKRELETD